MKPSLCESCQFYVSVFRSLGECHRYPPVAALELVHRNNVPVFTTQRPEGGGWPQVSNEDWCGEWRAVKGAKA